MKQYIDNLLSKINTEIETSCMDSDISSDKALYMIDFIRPLFEELREFIHQYTFWMQMKKYYSSKILSHSF